MRNRILQLAKRWDLTQRGDGGTIYIVFIMAIIIGASYVMVNGLNPSFDESNAMLREKAEKGENFRPGKGGLPPLPKKGTEEYKEQRECAEKLRQGISNKQIAKKGKVKGKC